MLECPKCKTKSITSFEKALLKPSRSIICDKCNTNISLALKEWRIRYIVDFILLILLIYFFRNIGVFSIALIVLIIDYILIIKFIPLVIK